MKTDRPFRLDRGITMTVVNLLVCVTLVLCFTAIVLWAQSSDLATLATQLRAEKTYEDNLDAHLQNQITQNLAPTGVTLTPEEMASLTGEKSAEEVKKRRGEILKAKEGDPADLARVREESGLYSTLENLLGEQAARISVMQLRFERAALEAKLAKEYSEIRTTGKPEILKDKEQYKARLTAMIKEMDDKIREVDATFAQRKAALTAQAEQLRTSIEEEQAAFRDFERRETGKLRKIRNDLEQMKQKEVIQHRVNVAHGKVLRPDSVQKTAFITLGSRERVSPGLRFKVARIGREGKFEWKADIEVKKVWIDTSEVAIVRAYEGAGPVIDGDLIVNPFYNPRRPVVVAFAGHVGDRTFNIRSPENNPKLLRFSAKEAANRIKEMGSEARMTVGLDADFVLFTEVTGTDTTRDSFPDYLRAVQLEIPIADAAEYYEFLGG